MASSFLDSTMDADLEQIASDVVQDAPGLKGIIKVLMKRLTKDEIRRGVDDGRVELFIVSTLLSNEKNKRALENAHLHEFLVDQYDLCVHPF